MSRPAAKAALAAGLVAAAALVGGCNANGPPRGPEEVCARSCASRASQCSPEECWRGCNLVLDRLTEREGDRVVACVASQQASRKPACDDRTWSHCATRVGPYADGGPPAPPPPSDDDVPDDGD